MQLRSAREIRIEPMRTFLAVLTTCLCVGATAFSQPDGLTALTALKLLPKGAEKRVARIEARDGTPAPGRWHILVYDPKEESGVHEYVIAAGEVVASRSVSQFAEKLAAEDVITSAVKIDSDQAARVAQQYALANNVNVATLNYELGKEGVGASPLWKITCLDESNRDLGSITLTASRGTVVSHEGFPVEPVVVAEKLQVQASSQIAYADVPDDENAPAIAEEDSETAAATPAPVTKKNRSRSRSRSREDDPSFFRRAGGKLQKFFTGRDTISR